MKEVMKLMALAVVLALAQPQPVPAQSPAAADAQELVDSTRQHDSLEAYSDTTGGARDAAYDDDSTVVSRRHRIGGYSGSDGSVVDTILGHIGMEGLMGMTFALVVLTLLFVLAPVLLLVVLLFFVYKNRKQKMQLAEAAVRQGQPIPEQLLEHRESDDELWQKGIRQTFLGVGLLAFFGYVGSTLGIGIGILVTAIGLGKLVIVKTGRH